jgi:hypothetical protein
LYLTRRQFVRRRKYDPGAFESYFTLVRYVGVALA